MRMRMRLNVRSGLCLTSKGRKREKRMKKETSMKQHPPQPCIDHRICWFLLCSQLLSFACFAHVSCPSSDLQCEHTVLFQCRFFFLSCWTCYAVCCSMNVGSMTGHIEIIVLAFGVCVCVQEERERKREPWQYLCRVKSIRLSNCMPLYPHGACLKYFMAARWPLSFCKQ